MRSLYPNIASAQIEEVKRWLREEAPVIHTTGEHLAVFLNGTVDLRQGKMIEHSPAYGLTARIPWNYREGARSEKLNNVLEQWTDDDTDVHTLLLQVAGYMMSPQNDLQKMFMLVGDGAGGKSTFMNFLKAMLGKSNCTALSPDDLMARFNRIDLVGKLANIADEISPDHMSKGAVSMLKMLTTGEEVKVEQKNQPIFTVEPKAALMFAANELPGFSGDPGGGLFRRVVVIPWQPKENMPRRKGFLAELTQSQVMEAFIYKSVQAVSKVLSSVDQEFIEPEKVRAANEEYREENKSSVELYLETLGETREEIREYLHDSFMEDVHLAYQEWCYRNSYKPLKSRGFHGKARKFYSLGTDIKRDPLTTAVKRTYSTSA